MELQELLKACDGAYAVWRSEQQSIQIDQAGILTQIRDLVSAAVLARLPEPLREFTTYNFDTSRPFHSDGEHQFVIQLPDYKPVVIAIVFAGNLDTRILVDGIQHDNFEIAIGAAKTA